MNQATLSALIFLAGSVTGCGAPAWGQNDGFAYQVSAGCETQQACTALHAVAKWRVAQCGAQPDSEICAEAQEQLQVAANLDVAQVRKSADEKEAADTSSELEKQQSAEQMSSRCQAVEQQLKEQLKTQDDTLKELDADVKILRLQLKDSTDIVKTLTENANQ